MKKQKPLFKVIHTYLPAYPVDYLNNMSQDSTSIDIYKLYIFCFGRFKRYEKVEGYCVVGKRLAFPELDYWVDVFEFSTREAVTAHLLEYKLILESRYYSRNI